MDSLPPDKNPPPAEVFTKESSAPAGLNSLDILLAQGPTKTQEQVTTQKKSAESLPTNFEELPASKQKAVEDEYNKKHKGEIPIGDATMDKSETISVRIRRMGGMHADGIVTYKKGSEHYDNVLNHIGGMKPGDVKLVAPWPDEKPKNPSPQNKKGG